LIKRISMMPILVGFFLRLIIIFRTECLHYMPVATLWSCSPYFLCSLLWIFSEKNYGMEDLILIVQIYILSLVKYCSLQMLYFTWHNFFIAACLIPLGSEACLILMGIHLCRIYLLQAELAVLLLFLCKPMSAGPATYMCLWQRLWVRYAATALGLHYKYSMVSSASTLDLLCIYGTMAI
jgi:hypothetical protein